MLTLQLLGGDRPYWMHGWACVDDKSQSTMEGVSNSIDLKAEIVFCCFTFMLAYYLQT